MLSADFPVISGMYKGHKSQASAMEHAIRWQINVDLEDKDPAQYQRFKDRLDGIIQLYQGNWEQMIKELTKLKSEIAQGRTADPRFTTLQAPFFELIRNKISAEITPDLDEKIVAETKTICSYVKAVIVIGNFWEKADEIKKLSDRIASRFRLGTLRQEIKDVTDLTGQIMKMVKANYVEILRRINDLA